jgi:hypothetical protein
MFLYQKNFMDYMQLIIIWRRFYEKEKTFLYHIINRFSY